MTSKRKSSIGGFHHKITIHKGKAKGCEIDTISYSKMKESELYNQTCEKEKKLISSKSKNGKIGEPQEVNLLEKYSSDNVISSIDKNVEEILNFGKNSHKKFALDDCDDFERNIHYDSNFEDVSLVKKKISKNKRNISDKSNKKSEQIIKKPSKISKSELHTVAKESLQNIAKSLECEGNTIATEEVANELEDFPRKNKKNKQNQLIRRKSEISRKVSTKVAKMTKETKMHEENKPEKLSEKSEENDHQDKDTFCKSDLQHTTEVLSTETVKEISKSKTKAERRNNQFNENIECQREGDKILQNIDIDTRKSKRIASLSRICYKERPLSSKLRA